MPLFEYKGGFYTPDELIKALTDDGTIREDNTWENEMTEFEVYTPTEFLKAAQRYLEQNDLIQAAAKTWLAAVYVVKLLYLQAGEGFHIRSHPATKFFCGKAINLSAACTSIWADVQEDWTEAEECHRFSYGSTCLSKDDIAKIKNRVERFVQVFQNTRPDEVESYAQSIVDGQESAEGIIVCKVHPNSKDSTIKMAGQTFHPTYVFK